MSNLDPRVTEILYGDQPQLKPISEPIKTAIKAVLNKHDRLQAIKLLRFLISAHTTQFDDVEYLRDFKHGELNTPSLKWCVDYVDYVLPTLEV